MRFCGGTGDSESHRSTHRVQQIRAARIPVPGCAQLSQLFSIAYLSKGSLFLL